MSRMPSRQMSTSSSSTSYSQRAIPGLPGKQIKLSDSRTYNNLDNSSNTSQIPSRKMSTSSTGTSGSHHIVPGLPGRQVKVSHSDAYNHLPPRQPSQPQMPSHTPIRGPSPRRNPNPLGISVNTQVTRHQGVAPTQVFPNATPETTDNEPNTNSLAPATTTPTSKKKRREAPKPLDLSKELSPNDREIPIIFSSNSMHKGFIRNLHTQDSAPGNSLDKQVIISPLSANAPQIIVTPVEGNVGQAYGSPTSLEPRMPRPPSSLYSRRAQGTRERRAASESQSVRFAKESTFFASAPVKSSNDALTPGARSRRASEATVIDDDSEPDSPAADEETPLTAGGKAKRGSLTAGSEGVPTPRRSKGWWNVVFPSPFFSRFSAAALSVRGLPTDQRDSVPEVPSLNLNSPSGGPRGLGANITPPSDRSNDIAVGEGENPASGAAAEYYDRNKTFETPPASQTQIPVYGDSQSPSYNGDILQAEKGPAIGENDHIPTGQPVTKIIPADNPLGIATERQVADGPVTQQTSRALQVPPTLHQIQTTTTTENHYTVAHSNEAKSPSPVIEMASVGVRYSRSAKSIVASRSSSVSPDIPPQPPSKEARQTVFPGAFTPSVSGNGPLSEKPLYKTTFSAKANTASSKTLNDQEKPSNTIRRSIFSRKTTYTGSDRPPSRKQKCLIASIAVSLFIVLLLAVVLAMTLVKGHSDMPVQAAWLNLTGYPPMQTGIATIARPNATHQESGCVQPKQLWSCDLSADEMQADSQTNAAQPNFRLEVRFKNDSAFDPSTMQIQNQTTRLLFGRAPTVSASHIVRNAIQRVRRDFSSVVFNTNPLPPGQEDQQFLGRTTDGNQARFEGEPTPFYISILPSINLNPNITLNTTKRQLQSQPTGRQTFANLTSSIPDPSLAPNGTAAPSNLYPFPESQMLMLYNRGREDEHYGFYTYFDRTLLMHIPAAFPANSSTAQNNSQPTAATASAVSLAEANAQCTWSQTRFKVAIWTNNGRSDGQSNATGTSAAGTGAVSPRSTSQNTTSSSANDFTPPGSFALPVTITLDRHGGDPAQKAVYCYGLSAGGFVDTTQKLIWQEDRGFGGNLVAPAAGPFADNMKIKVEDGGMGGIDGGSGGCGCEWVNW